MSILPKRTTIDPSTAKERKITARNVKVIGSLLALAGSAYLGPSAFAGQSIRSILGAIKLAPGRVGNIKLADTVGKRIKQAQAIDPKLAKADWARFGTGGTTSLVGMGKGGRTLQKAGEQGPVKFIS